MINACRPSRNSAILRSPYGVAAVVARRRPAPRAVGTDARADEKADAEMVGTGARTATL